MKMESAGLKESFLARLGSFYQKKIHTANISTAKDGVTSISLYFDFTDLQSFTGKICGGNSNLL